MSRRFDDEITFYPDGTAVPYGVDPELPPAEPPPAPSPPEPLDSPRVPTAIGSLETRHGLRCGFHPRIAVADYTPVVTCTVCGERLDPYEVLRQFRRKERHFAYDLEHLRTEHGRLQSEVAELKRERTNLRAQVRRATRADGGEVRLRDTAEVRRIREQISRTTGGWQVRTRGAGK